MKIRATLIATLGVLVGSLGSFSAWAQWQWLDETGRKTYSDRPPPAHILDKNILQRPAGAGGPQPVIALPKAESPAAAAPEGEDSPKDQTANPEPAVPTAEERQRQKAEAAAKAAEAAKQAEEHARLVQQRQENCNRAQAALRTLQSNVPLAQMGPDGQPTTMSDAQRQQDILRAQSVVARDCGPLPADK